MAVVTDSVTKMKVIVVREMALTEQIFDIEFVMFYIRVLEFFKR